MKWKAMKWMAPDNSVWRKRFCSRTSVDWLIDWPTGWLTGWIYAGCSIWITDYLACWLVVWLAGCVCDVSPAWVWGTCGGRVGDMAPLTPTSSPLLPSFQMNQTTICNGSLPISQWQEERERPSVWLMLSGCHPSSSSSPELHGWLLFAVRMMDSSHL